MTRFSLERENPKFDPLNPTSPDDTPWAPRIGEDPIVPGPGDDDDFIDDEDLYPSNR